MVSAPIGEEEKRRRGEEDERPDLAFVN